MISYQERRRLEEAVDQLVKAEVANSWRGSGNPADISAIKAELAMARSDLHQLLNVLEGIPGLPFYHPKKGG